MDNGFSRKRGSLKGGASGGTPLHPDREAVWDIILSIVSSPERSSADRVGLTKIEKCGIIHTPLSENLSISRGSFFLRSCGLSLLLDYITLFAHSTKYLFYVRKVRLASCFRRRKHDMQGGRY